jgi:hypothetical protein
LIDISDDEGPVAPSPPMTGQRSQP